VYHSRLKYQLIFLGYLLLFSLFYYPFVYNDLLPGRIDSWFNLGIFKNYANIINASLTNSPIYLANYPEGKVFLYGESSLLSGLFFWILSLFFHKDLQAYIAFYILIQTLNSFSFALFVKTYLETDYISAFSGGLFFSFSAFNLGFFDNIVYSIWFPLFFSLYLLSKLSVSSFRNSILTALSLYSLLYFSVYNFFMGIIIILSFSVIYNLKEKQHLKKLVFSFLLFSPLIIPFVYLYAINPKINESFTNYLTLDLIDTLGFRSEHLLKSFQSNFIYGSGFSPKYQEVNYYWTLGWHGISVLILFLIGILSSEKKLLFFCFSLIILGITLSFGPFWAELKGPSYYLYRLLPILTQFKLIFKFYYLVHIGIILLAIQGMKGLRTKVRNLNYIPFILTCVFLAENLPTNPLEFSTPFYFPELKKEDLVRLKSQNKSTLFLPMCAPMFPEEDNKACFVEGRAIEFRYLYWQARFKINFLNGANGTIPDNRMEINGIFQNNEFLKAIYILKQSHHLSHIFFDKKSSISFNNPDPNELKQFLRYKETQDYIIFTL